MEKTADLSSTALAIDLIAGGEIREQIEKSIHIHIQGSGHSEHTEKRIVYGVVLRPDVVDFHDDIMSAEEVEKAAHHWMATRGDIGLMHMGNALALPLESFIAPVDMTLENGSVIKKGDWVMAVKIVCDVTWARVKNGEITGFSVGGFGIYTMVETAA
jgi:hypothetical protein